MADSEPAPVGWNPYFNVDFRYDLVAPAVDDKDALWQTTGATAWTGITTKDSQTTIEVRNDVAVSAWTNNSGLDVRLDDSFYIATGAQAELLMKLPAGDYLFDAAMGNAGGHSGTLELLDGTGDGGTRATIWGRLGPLNSSLEEWLDAQIDTFFNEAGWFARDVTGPTGRGVEITIPDRSGEGPNATGLTVRWANTNATDWQYVNYLRLYQ